MTIEKAIEFIRATRNARKCIECKWKDKCQNDVCAQVDRLAISALEKQVAKKIVPTCDGDVLHCPNCDFDLMGCAPVDFEDTVDCCLKCGQRLEWE